jgi:hypothetical protein
MRGALVHAQAIQTGISSSASSFSFRLQLETGPARRRNCGEESHQQRNREEDLNLLGAHRHEDW